MAFLEDRNLLKSPPAAERFSSGQDLVQEFDPFLLHGHAAPASVFAETPCGNLYLSGRTKRLLDFTVAAIAVVLLSPLLLLVASGICITSSGPVLFVQNRGGRDQRSFRMMKFRSMHVQMAPAVVQATPQDPRATPFGRLLRRTSIDELPQLFNVLKGEMSIVGPRPHAIEHDEFYGKLIGAYKDRYACKPGITGLAQVNGCRGATPAQDVMLQRVELDLQYIRTASLSLDLQIIFRTFGAILTCRNAY